MRIVVLGGGSWGTSLANLLAGKGYSVHMLMRDEENARRINAEHINSVYLPDFTLNHNLKATTNAEEAFSEVDLALLAVPCQSMRQVLASYAHLFTYNLPVVCSSKGLELGSHKTMQGVVTEELPNCRYAILSGPSFAVEVMQGHPTAVVLGCTDKALADELQAIFSADMFRVYSNSDVTGVEIGGAIKNVIAIATGICDGLGYGHNARAAIITRGIAELSRLGEAMGARAATFMGLSGMGDLVLTCTGDLSRNRHVGLALGQGQKLDEIIAAMRMVAEGVKTTEAAVTLAEDLGVDMPIARAVKMVLDGDIDAAKAVAGLMRRALKSEHN